MTSADRADDRMGDGKGLVWEFLALVRPKGASGGAIPAPKWDGIRRGHSRRHQHHKGGPVPGGAPVVIQPWEAPADTGLGAVDRWPTPPSLRRDKELERFRRGHGDPVDHHVNRAATETVGEAREAGRLRRGGAYQHPVRGESAGGHSQQHGKPGTDDQAAVTMGNDPMSASASHRGQGQERAGSASRSIFGGGSGSNAGTRQTHTAPEQRAPKLGEEGVTEGNGSRMRSEGWFDSP